MDKNEIVAGLAEINAFCNVIINDDKKESNILKRWEEYTNEAIKLINEKC